MLKNGFEWMKQEQIDKEEELPHVFCLTLYLDTPVSKPTDPRVFPLYNTFKIDIIYLINETNMKELNKNPMG